MTKRQISKYGMFHVILHFLLRNLLFVKKIPALQNAVTVFEANLMAIDVNAPAAVKKTTGAAAAKKVLRINLVAQALTISSLLYAFASARKDEELKKKVSYTKGEFDSLAYEEVAPVCKLILSFANQYINDMTEYMLSQDTLDSFGTAIADFQEFISKPQLEETDKRVAANRVLFYYNECDNILENNIDRLMMPFKKTDPEFYDGFQKNRRINNPLTRHTRLSGKVADSVTGKGVAGVVVLHQTTGSQTVTDENGDFVLPLPLNGKQAVIFSNDKYETVTSDVEFKLGQTTTVNISMKLVK